MYILVQTWWTIFRISLAERLAYRADFWLGTLFRFLPIVTQVFLWTAVFSAIASTSSDTEHSIAGYTRNDFIAYYLLTMVSRALSSMPSLASGIAGQIRSGEIKKYMIQPINFIGFLLFTRLAHKAVYYAVAAGPFALVFYLCRSYFPGWPPGETLLAYFISLALAFTLGFFLEATIGMIGFWFLEVSSLLFVYMLFSFFFSGHMFPLDMLPDPWSTVVQVLPLQYLTYFPAAVFLQKVTGPELWQGIMIQAAWTLFFIGTCNYFYKTGIKRYSGFGG